MCSQCTGLCDTALGLWQDSAHKLLEMFHIGVVVDHFPTGNAFLECCYMACCHQQGLEELSVMAIVRELHIFLGKKKTKKGKNSALANTNTPVFP